MSHHQSGVGWTPLRQCGAGRVSYGQCGERRARPVVCPAWPGWACAYHPSMAVSARRVVVDLVVGVDPSLPEPLHRQVYRALRAAMLEHRLKAGAKLPSTRALASMLGVARNTVHGAYDQLLAEGYLEARHGSGTYVAASLPDDAFQPGADDARPGDVAPGSEAIPLLRSGRSFAAPNQDAQDGAARSVATSAGAPQLAMSPVGPLSAWGQRVAQIGETPYLGEKGIGRLSAMRLGEKLRVETARSSDEHLNLLDIDWTDFADYDAMLDQVPVDPTIGGPKPTSDWSGTSTM